MSSEFVYFSPEGVNPDKLTEAQQAFSTNAAGRYVLIRVRNNQGRVTVMSAKVIYSPAEKTTGKREARQ